MNNEYIIVNKTAIQKRIEELETIEAKLMNEGMSSTYIMSKRAKIDELYYLLHQSTPLIPEIKKAYNNGAFRDGEKLKDYISNLKLDI